MLSRNDSDDGEYKPPFPWRWVWIALAVAVLGGVGYLIQQRIAAYHDVDVVHEMVDGLADRYAEVDRDYAASMEAHRGNMPFSTFGPQAAINSEVRAATREWVKAGIAVIDDALARRGRIQGEITAGVEATGAGPAAKAAMLGRVREAVLKTQKPARAMEAMRAYLEKIGEMAADLDAHAQGIALQEGELQFDDPAAGERYNDLLRELDAREREVQRLKR
jgi:hypothetical protein